MTISWSGFIYAQTPTLGLSVDQLMADSLSNLQLKANRPVSNTDFKKFSQPVMHGGRVPSPLAMHKKYTPTDKSHDWAQPADFSGVFAEHSQHEQLHKPGGPPPQDPLIGGEDDGFGDFHSVQSAPSQSHSPLPVPFSVASVGPGSSALANQSFVGVTFPGTAPIIAVPPSGSPQLTRSCTQPRQSALQAASSAKFVPADLPYWLAPCLHGPAPVPPVYNSVYQTCSMEGSELTTTEKLFPVLMSSGLERAALGQLWTVVNLSVPGQLTRVELYVLLGLIGLVQVISSGRGCGH